MISIYLLLDFFKNQGVLTHPLYSIQKSMRPVRATICGSIELPLQGDSFYKSFYPGRCPGLWRILGFQPALFDF